MKLEHILERLELGEDAIYSYDFSNTDQENEMRLRQSVAAGMPRNYLHEIAKHHSIPVMDKEIERFLENVRHGGIIIDVGGGWGWHWRRLKDIRPDIVVLIIDFARKNLINAKMVLKSHVNKSVYLVHGDATALVFDDNAFDGYWSVQTLQHIPDFSKAIREAYRVLKPGGIFANYSLNSQFLIRLVYGIFGKAYHIHGEVPGSFYLSRASGEQISNVSEVFSSDVNVRYSEIFFKPELGLTSPGREQSFVGRIDRMLSSGGRIFSWVARQQSFHVAKPVR
ncbi:MAG: class I SAM-dependent methyltransferase [Deltaproteobacteria bacterium]|nr:class I SAM-dependent methyltransferase [Deltaproteobacteria bacterium]